MSAVRLGGAAMRLSLRPKPVTHQAFRNRRQIFDQRAAELKKTPLYDLHRFRDAKMLPFHGYIMPSKYEAISSGMACINTRRLATLFDECHMEQHTFKGPDAAAFLEKVTPSEIKGLGLMQSRRCAFLNYHTGGIMDLVTITRVREHEFHVVTTGGYLETTAEYLDIELGKFGGKVEWTYLDNSGLISLQGPKSADALRQVLASEVKLEELYFGNAVYAELKLRNGEKTHPVLISRTGLTGEDGFEISFNGRLYDAETSTLAATQMLLDQRVTNDTFKQTRRVHLAGTKARERLRVEAGLIRYGRDVDATVTPIEAGLSSMIAPSRFHARTNFNGYHKIRRALRKWMPTKLEPLKGYGKMRQLVGFTMQGELARTGDKIIQGRTCVGNVTSCVYSTTLGTIIGLALAKVHPQAGPPVPMHISPRDQTSRVWFEKLPLVPHAYYKRPDVKTPKHEGRLGWLLNEIRVSDKLLYGAKSLT